MYVIDSSLMIMNALCCHSHKSWIILYEAFLAVVAAADNQYTSHAHTCTMIYYVQTLRHQYICFSEALFVLHETQQFVASKRNESELVNSCRIYF